MILLNYFLSEKSFDNVIYSIDKVCVMGYLEWRFIETFSDNLSVALLTDFGLSQELSFPWLERYCKDYKTYYRYGVGEYKNNIQFTLSDDSSFYLGYKHNSNKINECSWKIELNPNKCLPCEFVYKLLRFFITRSKCKTVRISQCDLCIDFPLARKNFYLEKDKRIYSTCNDGADNITEYLSRHNNHGFCKLYNKTVEADLDYDLTRFEITLKEFDLQNVCSVFPRLHYYDNSQIKFSDTLPKLSQNDEIFVELLRLHPDKVQYLTRPAKRKFKPYIELSAKVYKLDVEAYQKLIERMKVYFIDGL